MNSDCPICYEHVNRGCGYKFDCSHKICTKCVFGCKRFTSVICPLCRHEQKLYKHVITTRNITKFNVACRIMINLIDEINLKIISKNMIKFANEHFINYSGIIPKSIYFILKIDISRIKEKIIVKDIKIELYKDVLDDMDTLLNKL
jgi:hypothetical protein